MHPILFDVAGRAIRSQGVMYILAAIVTGVYAAHIARRHAQDTRLVVPGLALVVAAAYLGARLHSELDSWVRYGADPAGALLQRGELSFFGGLALGMLGLVAYLRWNRLPVGKAADALAPIGPVVYAIFRLGCLLNGDDYGLRTSMPWGMSFPEGMPPTTERVHPAQLYEILLMVPISLWLRWRRTAALPAGALTFELCILMGAERFVVDSWRLGDAGALGLATSQWLALSLVVVGSVGRGRVARPPVQR